jgi:hypothetical protein
MAGTSTGAPCGLVPSSSKSYGMGRKNLANNLLPLVFYDRGGSSICSGEVRYLPECCTLSQLRLFRGFPYILVVCEELMQCFSFVAGWHRDIVWPHLRPSFPGMVRSLRPALRAGVISPVHVYVTGLCQVSCPPSLCVW